MDCRWFGLILLPFVSFSADGAIVIMEFVVDVCKFLYRAWRERKLNTGPKVEEGNTLGQKPSYVWNNPLLVSEFAHGRPIDLSIQFTLWWMPVLVLLGWWSGKPMHLLFGKCVIL